MVRTVSIIQGLFEITGISFFFVGIFFDIHWAVIAGGILLVIDDLSEILLGILNPLTPLLLAIIGVVIAMSIKSPWYIGLFWSIAAIKVIGIPSSIKKIFVIPNSNHSMFSGKAGPDSYYQNIKAEEINSYQYYFEKIIDSTNLYNYTGWTKGSGNYDRDQLKKDDKTFAKICKTAELDRINSRWLQVLTHQYFFADEVLRVADKSQWIQKVLSRNKIDYFPDAYAVEEILELSQDD